MAVVGPIVIVCGALVAVDRIRPKWQNIHDDSPAPWLGNIIAGFSPFIVAVDVILLLVDLVI